MDLPDFLTRHPHGEIQLTGHRIDLMHVVDLYNEGHTAEQLHEEFPTLPLDLICQALDFYLANKNEVDAYVTHCHEEMERNYAAYEPGLGVLKVRRLTERLRQADAIHATDSGWLSLSVAEKLRRVEAEEHSKTG